MKKSTLRRLLLLCLCLTLVTVSLIGGTLAKYTTTVSGTATVSVAQWNFTAATAGSSETFTAALKGSGNGGTIVPGDNGTFTIALSKAGTDADITVTYTVSTTTDLPDGFSMKVKDAQGAVFSKDAPISDDMSSDDETVTIYWEYAESVEAPITLSSIALSVKGEQKTAGGTQTAVSATKDSAGG